MRGQELLKQVFPIYLVTLEIIRMCLFDLFFVLMRLAGISVPMMQYTTKIVCNSMTYNYINDKYLAAVLQLLGNLFSCYNNNYITKL